ncbi:MAG: 2,3-bisphosphoglycerate-independent phosphoglycerate mutase [Roseiflexaceae bacterium]
MADARPRPVLLAILDGLGERNEIVGNAVKQAHTPNLDRWRVTCPTTLIYAAEKHVGLPTGQMGNSEVGHLNLGAGFVVMQDITRIDSSIEDGSFYHNDAFLNAVAHTRKYNSNLHIVGLLGNGGVHSHIAHQIALLKFAKRAGIQQVFLHIFTDGRDALPRSGAGFLQELETAIAEIGIGTIATVSGRYYAMDRDKRWERTKLAYDAMVNGFGEPVTSASDAIQKAYAADITDEFIKPAVVMADGAPVATIQSNDAIIGFNFRADRMRQITRAFVTPDFAGFERTMLKNLHYVCMTEYEKDLPVTIAFANDDVENPLAKVISDAGLTQLHAAETEKYPHVTFYFNGGREIPFPGEERLMVASPKVATYDLQPEMSAAGIRDGILQAITDDKFDVIIVNFANPDMVGHTGVLSAVITAVETVDQCIGALVDAVTAKGGVALVTADHGNAEYMIDGDTGGPFTAHTINQVPVILVAPDGSPYQHVSLRTGGRLSDIAPTVLDLLKLTPAPQMTGTSLINH